VRWECTAFRAALGGLREEFVVRRRLLLQVVPNVVDEGPAWARAALEDAGFQRIGSGRPYRTIMVDLQRPLEEIRKCLAQKWRNCLNSALRTDLEIREGSSEAEYATFLSLYAAMRKRKAFDCGVDVDRWGDMQAALPDREKLRVFTAYSEGSPVAAVVASCMGDTGRYLLGATGEQGLKTKASYALHWRVIERLVERGFRQYDLGGIDPEKNPGGYQFKSRMGGREVRFLGSFQCCQSVASRIAVSVGVGLRKLARRCR
jgi:lipid II:glycine glycyltransferase (peptidoglycan interpeptide bridge formation enzyme)